MLECQPVCSFARESAMIGMTAGGCAGAQVGRHQVPRWQRLEEALVEQLLSCAHSSRVARTACAVVSTAGGAFSCRVYAVSKAHLTVVRTLASCTAQRVHGCVMLAYRRNVL